MNLSERIYKDYVTAMKAKDRPRVEFLSYLRSQIKYAEMNVKEPLTDNDVLVVLLKQKKNLQETLESVKAAADAVRTSKAEQEIAVINEYLPQQIGEAELRKIIDEEIAVAGATNPKDMGRVMKAVMARVGASAEARMVSEMVKTRLTPPPIGAVQS